MMIRGENEEFTDYYNGRRIYTIDPEQYDGLRFYRENVINAMALKLDQYSASSQLWKYFDPAVGTEAIMPPVLDYVTGPNGNFWFSVANFEQIAPPGKRVTALTLWAIEGTEGGGGPAHQNALQLSIDGQPQDRVGGEGGTSWTLDQNAGSGGIDTRSATRDWNI